MTRQQQLILAGLAAVAVVIFGLLGCFALLLVRGSPPLEEPVLAAVTRQPLITASLAPSPTALPPPPVTPTPMGSVLPTPTGTRVVTQTVQPTPSPTPANCINDIRDFEASGIITNEQVQAYLRQTIPAKHLDRCQGIRYIHKLVSVHATPAAGRFIPLFRQISVYAINPDLQRPADLLITLTHEVGHNVHFNMRIDDWELATRWSVLYEQSLDTFARTQRGFVSDYARTNQFEDFAETYRAYVIQPELLKSYNPEKYEFMRQEVFAGQEYLR